MRRQICKLILYNILGWKEHVSVEVPQKCVLAVAPHTSNFDFIIGELYYGAKGRRAKFLMKAEWFRGPLGKLLRKMGGIAVERDVHTSMTDRLAAEAAKHSHFQLAITPEGTRSRADEWKLGFYYIALKANLPIALFALDYETKTIECHKIVTPTGNIDDDMRQIVGYFSHFTGHHPDNFAPDRRYPPESQS